MRRSLIVNEANAPNGALFTTLQTGGKHGLGANPEPHRVIAGTARKGSYMKDLDYDASYLTRCANCQRWLQGVGGGKETISGAICNLCVALNNGRNLLDHKQLLALLAGSETPSGSDKSNG